jgi:predicted nucleotidyltransferase
VRTLLAVESGSRAWGFASLDSDYDVRFIYAHPPEWYLSVFEQRDVIEVAGPDPLDASGWELRKALRLFSKCNLALNEWLNSEGNKPFSRCDPVPTGYAADR